MKYILHLFLCVDGCVWRILGMGPGLVSTSPLSSIKKCRENVWIMRGFGRALCLCLLLKSIILWTCFVMCFGCLRVFFCVCLVGVVLCRFVCFTWFFCFWTRPVGRVRFRWCLWFVCCIIFVVFVGRGLDMGFRLVTISSLSIIRKCRESICIWVGFGCAL
jgi:hypothetical protein